MTADWVRCLRRLADSLVRASAEAEEAWARRVERLSYVLVVGGGGA
jgi:hypothetical protein